MNNLLVLQSDFGLVDGAVSAMIGVALEESATLKIHHLTHDITPYNIFEGSYRLFQTVKRKTNTSSLQTMEPYLLLINPLGLWLFGKFLKSKIVERIPNIPIPSMVVMFMPTQELNWLVATLLLKK